MKIEVPNCCSKCPLFNWDGDQMWIECKVIPAGKPSDGLDPDQKDHPDNSIVFDECPLKQGPIQLN